MAKQTADLGEGGCDRLAASSTENRASIVIVGRAVEGGADHGGLSPSQILQARHTLETRGRRMETDSTHLNACIGICIRHDLYHCIGYREVLTIIDLAPACMGEQQQPHSGATAL